jgi:hypothetical protein
MRCSSPDCSDSRQWARCSSALTAVSSLNIAFLTILKLLAYLWRKMSHTDLCHGSLRNNRKPPEGSLLLVKSIVRWSQTKTWAESKSMKPWERKELQRCEVGILWTNVTVLDRQHIIIILFLFGLWGYWHCGHSWPIVPASGDSEEDVEKQMECRLAGENPSSRRKPAPTPLLSITKSQMTRPGFEPGPPRWKAGD